MKKLRITINGKSYDVDVEILGEPTHAEPAAARPQAASAASVAPAAAAAAPKAAAPAAAGSGDVPSPLAGLVVAVEVQIGAAVTAGQKLITLEAMKMNTVVSASEAGTVKAIHVKQGDAVEEGQILVTLG